MDAVARTLAMLDRLAREGVKFVSIAAVRAELTRFGPWYAMPKAEPPPPPTPGQRTCPVCMVPVTVEPDGTLRGHGTSKACPGSGTSRMEGLTV